MTIIKRKVTADTEVTTPTSASSECIPETTSQYIRDAIDSLRECAKAGNESAKEAIANLSVVLFELS